MITNVFDLRDEYASEYMSKDIFTISDSEVITYEFIHALSETCRFTRIPVYHGNNKRIIKGYLSIRKLLLLSYEKLQDINENVDINETIEQSGLELINPILCYKNVNLLDLLVIHEKYGFTTLIVDKEKEVEVN